jgi:hypothetical protein
MKVVLSEIQINELIKRYKTSIISEQDITGKTANSGTIRKKVGTKTEENNLVVDMGKTTFDSGKYKISSLSAKAKPILASKLAEITQFIMDHQGTVVNIQVEVGESAVTNYDREKFPSTGNSKVDFTEEKRLSNGELSRLRGESIVNYLNTFFKQQVDRGTINDMPVVPQPQTNVALGTQKHKYDRTKDNPKDPKYLEDQYLKFTVTLTGSKTTDVYDETCLVDFVVDVSYVKAKDKNFPCRGGHTCDSAKFNLYLNQTLIGRVNLNNKNDGGDRNGRLVVNNEMVSQIIQGEEFKQRGQLILWTKCLSGNCHTSVQEVKLSNKENEVLYHKCVNPYSGRGNNQATTLLVLDKCGKVLQGDEASLSDVAKLADEINARIDSKKIEGLGEEGFVPTMPYPHLILGPKFVKRFGVTAVSPIDDNTIGVTVITNQDTSVRGFSQTYGKGAWPVSKGTQLKFILPYKEIKIMKPAGLTSNKKHKRNITKVQGVLQNAINDVELKYFTEGPLSGYYYRMYDSPFELGEMVIPEGGIFKVTFEQ